MLQLLHFRFTKMMLLLQFPLLQQRMLPLLPLLLLAKQQNSMGPATRQDMYAEAHSGYSGAAAAAAASNSQKKRKELTVNSISEIAAARVSRGWDMQSAHGELLLRAAGPPPS